MIYHVANPRSCGIVMNYLRALLEAYRDRRLSDIVSLTCEYHDVHNLCEHR